MTMMRSASRVLAHGIAMAVLVLPVAVTAKTGAAGSSREESQPASSASPESSGINAAADPLLHCS
jgi:hypothetical protein